MGANLSHRDKERKEKQLTLSRPELVFLSLEDPYRKSIQKYQSTNICFWHSGYDIGNVIYVFFCYEYFSNTFSSIHQTHTDTSYLICKEVCQVCCQWQTGRVYKGYCTRVHYVLKILNELRNSGSPSSITSIYPAH